MKGFVLPIIFARLDSRRLPGKVLEPVLGGRSIIEELLQQVRIMRATIPELGAPLVATTNRQVDLPIVQMVSARGVKVHTGHILPLQRVAGIAESNPQCWLWRLNADSPLLLSSLIARAVKLVSAGPSELKAVTNLFERTFPYGVSLEMFSAAMISQIDVEQATAEECEHLSPLVQRLQPSEVRGVVAGDLGLPRYDPSVRLTIDTEEDATFFSSLWDEPDFLRTGPGSRERIDYAYRRRLSNAI